MTSRRLYAYFFCMDCFCQHICIILHIFISDILVLCYSAVRTEKGSLRHMENET